MAMKSHRFLWASVLFLSIPSFAQTITRFAGSGAPGYGGDGGAATQAQINVPAGIAVDADGSVIFADSLNYRIRKIAPDGTISTIAGTGTFYNDDVLPQQSAGPALSFGMTQPGSVVAVNGTVYVRDSAIVAISSSGTATPDYSSAASLVQLLAVGQSSIYSDQNGFAVSLYQPGALTVLAGDPNAQDPADSGDNGPALQARFGGITGLAADANGNVYVSDGTYCRIRKFQPAGTITTIAGIGTCASVPNLGDGGPATAAQLQSPGAITVDNQGNVYFASGQNRIRRINPQGIITAFAGSLDSGASYPGDGGSALDAPMVPLYLATDSQGNVYVSTGSTQNRIYKITPGTSGGGGGKPVIGGVVSAAANVAEITPKAWFSIYGQNLSTTSRSWGDADFNGTALPLSLDGVSVTVNGKPAAVSYISPGQINAQTPDDTTTGPVSVVVTNSSGPSDPFTVPMVDESPAFFVIDLSQHVAALHLDYSLVAPTTFGAGATPAVPGETIVIYGTGFGPTNPDVPAGTLFSGAANLSGQFSLSITIGGVDAPVSFAGLTGAGLYQFNVTVPQVPSGDQPIKAILGTKSSPDGAIVPIQ